MRSAPGPAGTCSRYPSDHCYPEAIGQCHHRSDQGQYAVQDRIFRIFRCGFQDDPGYERCREASCKGDMLFYPQGYQKPARLQGAFVSDEEVSAVVEYVSDKNQGAVYDTSIEKQVNTAGVPGGAGGGDRDVYFTEAGKFIIEKEKASIGMLQRVFKIGFNRAARIMDQLCEAGVVGEEEGTKPRKVLMSQEEFEQYIEEYL